MCNVKRAYFSEKLIRILHFVASPTDRHALIHRPNSNLVFTITQIAADTSSPPFTPLLLSTSRVILVLLFTLPPSDGLHVDRTPIFYPLGKKGRIDGCVLFWHTMRTLHTKYRPIKRNGEKRKRRMMEWRGNLSFHLTLLDIDLVAALLSYTTRLTSYITNIKCAI